MNRRMGHPGSPSDRRSGKAEGTARGGEPILHALDAQFPEVRWGATRDEVERLYPGGRRDPGGEYTVMHPLVGYPYPAVLTFGFEGALASVTVLYPRSNDLATGDMDLPGRMVAESIYRHLSALLIIAYGGAEDPYQEPSTVERGDQILGDHSWITRTTSARLEFHLQNGLARLRVTLRAMPPA
jgi:hypothetical protein